MNAYKVPTRASGYDGSGLVMAAIHEGEAVKLAYLRDLCPDYDGEDGLEDCMEDWLAYGPRPECRQKALEFEQIGHVVVGIASCWEVIEL
ncbi:hypothetical protein L1281_001742 [Neisseria sp. HSC-16F19]|nr:hypothetical protein [Neisseria sp. HSC-16F19]MCP2041148.1 hypothetical protein [Neisseria sp. HSC-16F19]